MGRDTTTLTLAEEVNADWLATDLPVDMFIEEQVSKRCAFDIRYLEEAPTYGGHTDRYAHFHVVDKGSVVTLYYWESRDRWFAKY